MAYPPMLWYRFMLGVEFTNAKNSSDMVLWRVSVASQESHF